MRTPRPRRTRPAATRGPSPEPLRVRTFDGRARYRTPLEGWYLRLDETLAIDTAGLFYVLRTPPSIVGRLRGVVPEPSDPPLVLGAHPVEGLAQVHRLAVLAAGAQHERRVRRLRDHTP